MTNGPVTSGFIAAFKVEDQGGLPSLTPEWISRDIVSPQTPVVANGVVFVLSSGDFTRRINEAGVMEERPKPGTHATLYALDARTGRELFSSATLVTVPAALTGLTVANGRAYFGGLDGALYAFGIPMER
jgi:outer membrane protein assembly factor BamB